MKIPDYDLWLIRSQANQIIDIAERELPDTKKPLGNQTRLQRAHKVSWTSRSFIQIGLNWAARGKADSGWDICISKDSMRCNCPDSAKRFSDLYCKHLCSLALAILHYNPEQ